MAASLTETTNCTKSTNDFVSCVSCNSWFHLVLQEA
jgi:hypothetical protein